MAITINSTIIEEGAYGEDTVYGVNATESNSKSISYNWQISEDSGTTWSNLSLWQSINIGNSILFFDNIIRLRQSFKDNFPNALWRVVLSAEGESSVQSASFGRSTPVNLSIISGSGEFENNIYNFRVFASAELSDDIVIVPKIKWQKSFNEGLSWENIEQEVLEEATYVPNENNLTISFSNKRNVVMKVRAVATTTGSVPVFSNFFDIFYNSSSFQQNLSIIFKGESTDTEGNTVYSVIASSSDGSEVFYQWQHATDTNLLNWQNLSDSSFILGSNTSNLILSPIFLNQNLNSIYRCAISSISSNTIFSEIFGLDETGLQINIVYSGGLNNSDPSNSIGDSPSSNPIIGNANNLFTDISKEESQEGIIDYRCFYITNDSVSGESLYESAIYVESQYNVQSSILIGVARQTEVQAISFQTTPTAGNFKLKVGEFITSPIVWNNNPEVLRINIQNALNDINAIEVVVQRTFINNYEISFVGKSDNRNYELITVEENNLSPRATIRVEKLSEGQPINSIAPKIFNSKSPPFNVNFLQTSFNNKLFIGDLGPGDIVPVWIRRYTYAEISADQLNGFNLRITGNKNKLSIVPALPQATATEKPNFYIGE